MSRRLAGDSDNTAISHLVYACTQAPARPAPEQDGVT
jgi:hypothetical protein